MVRNETRYNHKSGGGFGLRFSVEQAAHTHAGVPGRLSWGRHPGLGNVRRLVPGSQSGLVGHPALGGHIGERLERAGRVAGRVFHNVHAGAAGFVLRAQIDRQRQELRRRKSARRRGADGVLVRDHRRRLAGGCVGDL